MLHVLCVTCEDSLELLRHLRCLPVFLKVLPSPDAIDCMRWWRPVAVVVLVAREEPRLAELLSAAHRAAAGVPLIVVGASVHASIARSALRAGCADYVTLPDDIEYLCCRLGQLAMHVPPAAGTLHRNDPSCRPSTEHAVNRISLQLADRLVAVELAQQCSLTRSTFSRRFKRENGATFRAYLTGKRLAEAKRLLAGTSLSVKQIAFEVGYADVAYFIRIFKNRESVTPQVFRRQWLPAKPSPTDAQG